MEFREALPDDAHAIQRVARHSWHEAYDSIIGKEAVEEKIEEWYNRDTLQDSIEREKTVMFVAVADDVVGFAQGGPSEDGPADASLWRIYVLPAYWGEEIGTTLLNRICSALKARGHNAIWAAVMAENDVGRAFYAKHGFESHERRTVELAGQKVTEVIVRKEL